METRYVYDYQEGRMRSEEIKVVEKGRSSVRFIYFYYVS